MNYLYIKYMVSDRCKTVVSNILQQMGLPFVSNNLGEVQMMHDISTAQRTHLGIQLADSGLELMVDKKGILIERIKNAIIEMVHYSSNEAPRTNFSDYLARKLALAAITLASPKGGQPPIDPKSDEPDSQTPATIRYKADAALQKIMAKTRKLSEISADDFDAVFYPGGHGPMWDLANDADSIKLIEAFWKAKKPVAAVCHAPAALLHAKDELGHPLVKGRHITGFSNTEEAAVQLTTIVPFMLEDALKEQGGLYKKKEDWVAFVVEDGLLITGQNPASSEAVAKTLMESLNTTPSLSLHGLNMPEALDLLSTKQQGLY